MKEYSINQMLIIMAILLTFKYLMLTNTWSNLYLIKIKILLIKMFLMNMEIKLDSPVNLELINLKHNLDLIDLFPHLYSMKHNLITQLIQI
jgi:hypothetical protein